MALIVQKFGGSSVGSIERIENVARKVIATQQAGHEVVVVVSAMKGETDRLSELAYGAAQNTTPRPRELDLLLDEEDEAEADAAEDERPHRRALPPAEDYHVHVVFLCRAHYLFGRVAVGGFRRDFQTGRPEVLDEFLPRRRLLDRGAFGEVLVVEDVDHARLHVLGRVWQVRHRGRLCGRPVLARIHR